MNWTETIFCQFDDIKLLNSILNYATDRNCDIVEGKTLSDDIVATPAFVYIVDRNLLGKDNWQMFLESMEDSEVELSCVVIDENRQYESPKMSNITYIIPDKDNIKKIIDIIDTTHIIAQEVSDTDFDY